MQTLQRRGEAGAKEMSTRRVQLDPARAAQVRVPDEETVVVVQRGQRAGSTVGVRHWDVIARTCSLSARRHCICLPGATLDIHAGDRLSRR